MQLKLLEKMDWFFENHDSHTKFGIAFKSKIASVRSEYQQIDFYDTYDFGVIFTLDDILMLTQKDEFIYHEMLVHPAMAVNPDIRRILIIGGGDGCGVRELLRYPKINHIDVAEIDGKVVDLCKKYLPGAAEALSSQKVHVHICNGVEFVQKTVDPYDLIIVDSTDPIGVGAGLFSSEFYQSCFKALKPDGILINQHESPFYSGDALEMIRTHKKLKDVFPICKVYQFHMPTYASGHWLFGFSSKTKHPLSDIHSESWHAFNIPTRYYNTALHFGCFALPNYVLKLLEE
jgi:spermidine synthase